MRIRQGLIVAVLALAACVGDTPEATQAYVELSNGGGFSGSTVLRIHADDQIETSMTDPVAQRSESRTVSGRPGVYQEVLALLRVEGPKARRVLVQAEAACLDYGSDAIRVVPAVGGFAGISASCPDEVVLGLQKRVRALIAGG